MEYSDGSVFTGAFEAGKRVKGINTFPAHPLYGECTYDGEFKVTARGSGSLKSEREIMFTAMRHPFSLPPPPPP